MLVMSQGKGLLRMVAVLVLTFGMHAAVAAQADEYVADAREFVAKGQLKAAVIELKNALQADPAHVEARIMLGALYLRGADGAAAAKEFGRARDLGAPTADWLPGYTQALVMQRDFRRILDEVTVDSSLAPALQAELLAQRGNANLALESAEQARADYQAALDIDAKNPMARLGMAQILLSGGDDQGALAQLNQVVADSPSNAEVLLARADLLRRQQYIEDAKADYAKAVELAPGNPRAHAGLALANLALRDIGAAKASIQTLKDLVPSLPAVNYLQALVYFQEQNLDGASDELQELLRVAPTNIQAQLLYGVVSYARQEYTIADDYLTRVLASAPGNLQIVKLLGAARLKLRQPERAAQILSSAVTPDSSDAQLLALLGTAYIQSGDNTRGSEFIQRAVELDPDQALLRTQLAIGRIASGETAEAISQLESAVALGQDVIQADVLLVLSYLNKQQFDKAIAASTGLEQRMADSPIPYNLTGLAYLAQREFDQARARFERALQLDPAFVVARMNLARLALAADKPEDAEAAYQQVLRQDPKHLGAMLGMAGLAQRNNDSNAMQSWLQRANNANPDALQPIVMLAEQYLRRNEGLKAINVLSGIRGDKAELAGVLRLKGMAQLQSGDYRNATYTLRRLTEVRPDYIEAWFQYARAQAAAGDPGGARESFRRAVELDAEHKVPVVWIGLGELELREQRYAAALDVANDIQRHFPGNVYGYDIEAAAHRGLGEAEKALAAAEQALQVESTSNRMNAYANALAVAGQSGRAITVLQDWLKTNANDGSAWATLGLLQQQRGREQEAVDAYEQALKHVQGNAVLYNNLAWLYLERNGERAIEMASKAYEMAPSRAEIVDTYGWVLFKNGRQREGLAALQQALIIAPRNAEIALHTAQALHELQRDAEARPLLERVVREHPDSVHEKLARTLLGQLRG